MCTKNLFIQLVSVTKSKFKVLFSHQFQVTYITDWLVGEVSSSALAGCSAKGTSCVMLASLRCTYCVEKTEVLKELLKASFLSLFLQKRFRAGISSEELLIKLHYFYCFL